METPKKMVKRAKVPQGEFLLEGRYDVLQECYARCGEYNIINIKQQVYCIGAVMKDEQGVSDFVSTNPKVRRYMVNRLYQARGACFSPYKDLLRWRTRSGCMGSTNPVRWL
jgi:hypothetical protein